MKLFVLFLAAVTLFGLSNGFTITMHDTKLVALVEKMSSDTVWSILSNYYVDGSTGMGLFGRCRVAPCSNCACSWYFQSGVYGNQREVGWAKNPSGDSTGCLSGVNKDEAKAKLINALQNNACKTAVGSYTTCNNLSCTSHS